MATGTSRKSCIWNFYLICAIDELKAFCATYGEKISRGGKSAKTCTTTNLKKHLHSHHQLQFKELEQQEEAKTGEEANKQSGSRLSFQQVSLEFVVDKHQPFGFDHPKAHEINRLVAKLIAVDNQLFSVVDDIGFNCLIYHLDPRYKLPSWRYFSETLTPSIAI